MYALIDKLAKNRILSKEEFVTLIDNLDTESSGYLSRKALKAKHEVFGTDIYLRGIIEFSNYCRCNCYYCGLRRDNTKAQRYRLDPDTITACCIEGYRYGYRTFVLQSGEDSRYSDAVICRMVSSIKKRLPDCAVTLSVGEKSKESYRRYYEAGADRYLLRHEAASPELYSALHPENQRLESRLECLFNLKEIGYQTGAGIMTGAPGQNSGHIADDLLFMAALKPEMAGIGPFIPHRQTPFKDEAAGTVQLTLTLLSILRLMNPRILLPATTALGTLDPEGREKGIAAGANVVMPNLTPPADRKKYLLYNNKISLSDDAILCHKDLIERIGKTGEQAVVARGDYPALSST